MYKILEDPIPAPPEPITAGECTCTCKNSVTGLNPEMMASVVADVFADVSVDIEDPPG
jgi:hypothetical protein